MILLFNSNTNLKLNSYWLKYLVIIHKPYQPITTQLTIQIYLDQLTISKFITKSIVRLFQIQSLLVIKFNCNTFEWSLLLFTSPTLVISNSKNPYAANCRVQIKHPASFQLSQTLATKVWSELKWCMNLSIEGWDRVKSNQLEMVS